MFDRPSGFAEILEADHATAAFECVEGAAHRCERLGVMRMLANALCIFSDGGEDFVGFFDEDFQQFGVDFLGAGLGKLQGGF